VDARRSFYLDSNAGKGHLVTSRVRIIATTPELAHFAVVDDRALHLEHHFVMLKGESGIHPYVIIRSAPGFQTGETRTMYRFDMDILDWAWTPERTGKQPKYALLQSISEKGNLGDETWRLPDGTVYQKYDYSLYYAEAPMWGHYGHGFGVFFIPPSTESYAGGPLRQELAVHQDALILNYLGGGHYSGGGTAAGRSGEKIHGPWYLYFNTGATPEAIIADAKKTAMAERAKWPYQWMDEPLYPIHRTAVTGQLKISHGRSAAYAYVILGQPDNIASGRGGGMRNGAGEIGAGAGTRPSGAGPSGAGPSGGPEAIAGRGGARRDEAGRGSRGGTGAVVDRAAALYNQAGDYIFFVQADADGRFTLPAVRPGTYTLYAWQTQGPITQSLAKDGIEVKGEQLDLGVVDWDPPYHPHLLWQIGKADRMAGEFKFGDLPRTNQRIYQVPSDLTFTIGKSRASEDWYYAQRGGTWTVNFDVPNPPTGNAYLTIAIAGGSGNISAILNGQDIGAMNYGDDASVRRAANRSGRYGRNEYVFPAKLIRAGANSLALRSNSAGASGGLMYDTIVLEAD
jgi:hypothetical protein